jgi:hypothetical protein
MMSAFGTFRTQLLELMMSVHWVKADMRLRASRSDFDPRVRPLKPTVGGGQISGAYRRRTDGPHSHAKSPFFLKQKTHFGGRKRHCSGRMSISPQGSRLGHLREHALH